MGKCRKLEVGDFIDPDHFTLIVTLVTERSRENKKKKEVKVIRASKGDWSAEGKEQFKEKCENTIRRWEKVMYC